MGERKNGQLWQRLHYKKGIAHGLHEDFYCNGQLKVRENYVDGEKHSVWKELPVER